MPKPLPLVLLFLVLLLAPTVLTEDDPLPPSLRDQANAAIQEKDYAKAAGLYQRWLEADPRDDSSWYNLACCLALEGQKEPALEAFRNSVRAGWKDAEHPLQDADLASIREDERFQALIEKIREGAAKRSPKGFQRHWVKVPTLGTYIAMLPPDYEEQAQKAYPLVVILHGAGSSELGHGGVADRAGREGVIWIAPRAPYPHAPVFMNMKQEGWVWWPTGMAEEAMGALDPMEPYQQSILASIEDARKRYRVKPGPVFAFGHSMGGFTSISLGLRHPEAVASYFAYAGGLQDGEASKERLAAMKKAGVRPWIVHGKADPVVEAARSEKAYKTFAEAGVETRLHLFDDVNHGIDPKVNDLLQRWLKEVVRKP